MADYSTKPAPGNTVLIRLDDETNRRLLKARERSGRSKSLEALLRIQDHLSRFPDFYNSDLAEDMPTNK
jgi:predicted DNA-binding protein